MLKIAILFALLIQFFWDQFLTWLNIDYIKKNISKINSMLPDILKSHINEEDYIKAAEYSKTNASFGTITDIFNLIIISLVIYYSLLNPINEWTSNITFPRVAFCIVLLLITSFISLPFKVYQVFVIEEKFGFNKTTPKTFIKDFFKGIFLSILISAPLLWCLFYFYDIAGNLWWFWAFLLFFGFQYTMLILYPLIIAPLFNKFTPLENGELLDEIKKLTTDIKFPLKGVFIMDGSKRSSHSNAYFTGIGKSKRIVLFDTLVDNLTTKELVSVLAHELGHFKLHHVKINLFLSSAMSLLGFFILSIFLKSEFFFNRLGYNEPSIHIGLVLLAFILPVFDMIFGPLFNLLSRKHENHADRFSVITVGEKNSLSNALIKLNKDNLSNPLPHPLYSFISHSHPPLIERLKFINNLKINFS